MRIISFSLRHGKQLPVPPAQAIATVNQRISEQDPRSLDGLQSHFERGQLYLQAGMYDYARTDLDRVVEVTSLENPYFLEAQFLPPIAFLVAVRAAQVAALGNVPLQQQVFRCEHFLPSLTCLLFLVL